MSAPVRAVAAGAVEAVLTRGVTLEEALTGTHDAVASADRALLRELSAGTLRLIPRLDRILAELTDRPLDRLQPMVRALLLVGLYQLTSMRIATHAAVDQTVRATGSARINRAKGMINAVLRRYDRERDPIETALAADDDYRTAHPAWLRKRIERDWPEQAEAVFAAGNERPPMWLRAAGPREQAMQRLTEAGIEAVAPGSPPQAIRLATPVDVNNLPGFDKGLLSVQDASAQYAATLLDALEGMRVLDLCAAPGGKALHLLQSVEDLDLVALDVSEERMERVRSNLARAGQSATLITADAREPDAWWDGRAFDRVLVDAPCSGTGVIRRHPDIKSLRRESDIEGFAVLQRSLLDAAWKVLAPGGRLLYATCSVLAQEGDGVVSGFLADHDDARSVAIDLPVGRPTAHGYQVLSGEADQDGFHYAGLERAASP